MTFFEKKKFKIDIKIFRKKNLKKTYHTFVAFLTLFNLRPLAKKNLMIFIVPKDFWQKVQKKGKI